VSRNLILYPQPQNYEKNFEDRRSREIQQHTRELSIRVEDIETSVVPVGGTTGQVLKKNTDDDYDYDWAADGAVWGAVSGTLSDQTDLNVALGTKANADGTNFVIENRTSDPGSPVTGQIWLRTDL
jgi:hypothetical protein